MFIWGTCVQSIQCQKFYGVLWTMCHRSATDTYMISNLYYFRYKFEVVEFPCYHDILSYFHAATYITLVFTDYVYSYLILMEDVKADSTFLQIFVTTTTRLTVSLTLHCSQHIWGNLLHGHLQQKQNIHGHQHQQKISDKQHWTDSCLNGRCIPNFFLFFLVFSPFFSLDGLKMLEKTLCTFRHPRISSIIQIKIEGWQRVERPIKFRATLPKGQVSKKLV